jgi:hypothetical protein
MAGRIRGLSVGRGGRGAVSVGDGRGGQDSVSLERHGASSTVSVNHSLLLLSISGVIRTARFNC